MLPEIYEGRHPSVASLAKYFSYEHLFDGDMRTVSRFCHDLAVDMLGRLEDSPELAMGLRKLLEAKDCFVRAALGD